MPLINIVLVLIVVMADQPVHSHGVQYQDDFERRRGCGGRYLGIASDGPVGTNNQFHAVAGDS